MPTVELVDPGGDRVTVAPRSPDDRLGDLADALGLDPTTPLELDGRPVGRHDTLARAGLRRGSRLALGEVGPTRATEHARPDPDASPPAVVAVTDAGPAAGTAVTLPPGRHVVGRAAGVAVAIADPALEPHHGLLDVDADGVVHFVQLTGRVAARLDEEPVTGRVEVPDGSTIRIGASRLRVARVPLTAGGRRDDAAALTVTPTDPWRRTLRRTPRAIPRWTPDPIALPSGGTPARFTSGLGLTAALFTMTGSIVIAIVLRSPLFLLLGAAGMLASVGMWVAGRVGAARDGRRAGAAHQRELAAFTAAVAEQRVARWHHHLAVTPGVADAVLAATTAGAAVWARRADHPDAFRVTLGRGPVRWEVTVATAATGNTLLPEIATVLATAGYFDDGPVPASLRPGAALAVAGPDAPASAAVVRSVLVQLATWHGPADWRLVLVVDDPAAWDWCRWLPHGSVGGPTLVAGDDADAQAAAFLRLDDGDERHVLVVTDRPDLLAQRTGALRRYLGAAPSVALVVHVRPGEAVPAGCRSVLQLGSIGLARWTADSSATAPADAVHAAGVSEPDAARVARSLAGLRDPEDPAVAADALATSVPLGVLCETHGAGPIDDAIAIAAAWRAGGPDPPPAAHLGLTADGVVEVDLARDGPHALVAGTTGSGKSELLRTLVVSLAARCGPDHLTFVLLDYKGGSTFDACAELPHTVGLVTDLDDRLAERALSSLEAELRRRERLLRAVGAADLAVYRTDPARPPLPRLVVVVDEFATLAAELPAFLSKLVGVAQRGRSLGVHLVLATQRPAGVVDDDIRANTDLRLALRLLDGPDARDVVGDEGPVRFPRGTPGRAMLRLGPGETVVFQAARCTGPAVARRDDGLHVLAGRPTAADTADATDTADVATSELAVLVRSIRHAAALSDVAPPHRPWLPPLPTGAELAADPATAPPSGAVGMIDVPAEQRREPLAWGPADGNLALVGARGAGTTAALANVLAAAGHGVAPADRHVYVVDARGDDRLDGVARLPHCGAVVRPHQRERLGRLLDRLVAELDHRRAAGGRDGRPEIVVGLAAVGALRTALDGPLDDTRWEQLLRVVTEGAAVGIACVITAERPGAVPPAVLGACPHRWVFHLDDATDAPTCGVKAVAVPAAIPGRVVVAATGREAQLVPAVAVDRVGDRDGGPSPVAVLAATVDVATMPKGRVTAAGELELAVGVGFDTLEPAALEVPDGEHVLVAGPPRSGRTTALARLAVSWAQARSDGAVVVVTARRRSALADLVPATIDVTTTDGAGAVAAFEGQPDRPCLLLVDDAEHVDEPRLAALAAERRAGLLVAAAGRPEALRVLYGHWTTVVRRSRLGLLMAACADTDGDVLGELLPRHRALPARPGLAWVVGGGRRRLVQVAMGQEASR